MPKRPWWRVVLTFGACNITWSIAVAVDRLMDRCVMGDRKAVFPLVGCTGLVLAFATFLHMLGAFIVMTIDSFIDGNAIQYAPVLGEGLFWIFLFSFFADSLELEAGQST